MIKTNYNNLILIREDTLNFLNIKKSEVVSILSSSIKKKYPGMTFDEVDLDRLTGEKCSFDNSFAVYRNKSQLQDLLPKLFSSMQFISFIETNKKELQELERLFGKSYNRYNLISNSHEDAIKDLLDISIENYGMVTRTNIEDKKLFVIGDIHEDIEALKCLLEGVDNSNYTYCFNGDYLNKGNQTRETIDFLHNIKEDGNSIFIIGNHESFVYKRLKGQVSKIENESTVFSSISFFEKEENFETRNKFFNLYENSIPFLKFKNSIHSGFITHAPCKRKYLGNFDNESQRHQRNFYFKARSMEYMQDELAFMLSDEQLNDTIHIFGHVAHNMDVRQSNNYWIDTGSVYGGKLTGVFVEEEIKIKQVNGNMLYNNELFYFKTGSKPKI